MDKSLAELARGPREDLDRAIDQGFRKLDREGLGAMALEHIDYEHEVHKAIEIADQRERSRGTRYS